MRFMLAILFVLALSGCRETVVLEAPEMEPTRYDVQLSRHEEVIETLVAHIEELDARLQQFERKYSLSPIISPPKDIQPLPGVKPWNLEPSR